MTDEPTPTPSPESDESDLIKSLRDEMQTQYNTLKEAMDSALKERDDTIATLMKEKQNLQNALVVSATTPRVEEPPPKTEEELYAERIDALAKRTLTRMSERL